MTEAHSTQLLQLLQDTLKNGQGADAGTIAKHGENVSCGLHAVAVSINNLADSQTKLSLALIQLAGNSGES